MALSEVVINTQESRLGIGGDYKPDEKFIDILEKE